MSGILLADFHKLLKLKIENKHQMLSRIYLGSFLKIIYIYIYLQAHFANCIQIQENYFGIVAQISITKIICLLLKQNS